MAKVFARTDFLLKDLTVSVGGGGRSGVFLPSDEGDPPPSPVSPIASVVANLDLIEAVRGAVVHAIQEKRYDEIGRAFAAADNAAVYTTTGLSAAIGTAIHEIGRAVVASAAYAALGGSVGLPDPDCGGTSLETIPPTLSPVVHVGLEVHKVSELPRLQRQLAQTVAYVEKAVAAQAPRGTEVAAVRKHLESALNSLPTGEAAKA